MKKSILFLFLLAGIVSCGKPSPKEYDIVIVYFKQGSCDTIGIEHRGILYLDGVGNLKQTDGLDHVFAKGVEYFSNITPDSIK